MNETIHLLMNHRSMRKFKPDPVPEGWFDTILRAAQMASSSSNVQAYSIIAITNDETKRRLSVLSGNQAYIAECPFFLVWCADLHRLHTAYGMVDNPDGAIMGTTENFITATVDVSLAAQNAAVAAESLGLGIVYIGGIRNQIEAVSELLKLPTLVYPVFGMCIGFPNQTPILRPRLPVPAILHQEEYKSDHYETVLREYDELMKDYSAERSGGKVAAGWLQAMCEKFKSPVRMHMKSYLAGRGWFKDESPADYYDK